MVNCSNSILINSRTSNRRFPPRRKFFSRRIRNGYAAPVLSRWCKERGGSHPLFGSNVPLRTSTLGCKLVSTRATSTSLHVQWSTSHVTSGREFEASFSDSNRVESELVKPSYQSGSSHAAESLEQMEVTVFFFLSFIAHLFLFNFNYFYLLHD